MQPERLKTAPARHDPGRQPDSLSQQPEDVMQNLRPISGNISGMTEEQKSGDSSGNISGTWSQTEEHI